VAGWYVVFTGAQTAIGAHTAAADADAASIGALETVLHIDRERAMNAVLAAHPVLAMMASLYYTGFLLCPVATLAWCRWRHPDSYQGRRNVLIVLTLAALPVFATYAVAPPRLAMPGMVDVVAESHLIGQTYLPGGLRLGDADAAMPSLHIAWACWCAWAAALSDRRWVRWLAVLLPAVTAVDVIATGNHYVLDVVAGVALFALALGAASGWSAIVDRRILCHDLSGSARSQAYSGLEGDGRTAQRVIGPPRPRVIGEDGELMLPRSHADEPVVDGSPADALRRRRSDEAAIPGGRQRDHLPGQAGERGLGVRRGDAMRRRQPGQHAERLDHDVRDHPLDPRLDPH